MKSWSKSLGLGVLVMAAALCSCSVSTDNGNENTNANENENANGNENSNENENANGNENSNGNENGNGGANLVVFQDPDSDFSTTDVMDIDREIVRLDGAREELIWIADGTTAGGWDINGNLLGNGFFTVAFGTENGQRGAYFTETATATICDIRVDNGNILISPTTVLVPQE